jgi:ADP-heptose:LPS heptosyltransferase
MILVCLGRHGDLLNCLPIAYSLSRKVGRVSWLVSKEFAGTLDGCSYINPVLWNGGQDTLQEALRSYANAGPIVPQAWCNPDGRRLTKSFALEQWRLAGMLEEFGAWPLLLDQQNQARANMLRDRVLANRRLGKPLILACVDGVSSPFPAGNTLLAKLRGLDADVVDLRDVRAERVFDLLPLFNAVDCLVTIDTLPIHLARAAWCPTVCVLNDDWEGWRASVPPPQCVARFTYSEAKQDLDPIVTAAQSVISRPQCKSAVVVCNIHDTTSERALKARETWPAGWIAVKPRRWMKDSPTRKLAYMRDVLRPGLDTEADVVIWTNDDCAFTPGALDKIKAHCARWDFGCVRRDPKHIGREAFFFRREWLAANIDKMPDVVTSTSMGDLALSKWLRGLRGIKTTQENLGLDFPPVELPAGLIYHADHESSWLAYQDAPSAAWNRKLFDGLG